MNTLKDLPKARKNVKGKLIFRLFVKDDKLIMTDIAHQPFLVGPIETEKENGITSSIPSD